ncbi:MAG TPA: AbrB/MazE/SpoVT family DNA-binding domain-containing protein [Gemmatimonadales bacterium]|jgi:putative addiction module antidote|nr:AbrB/MazE/SpoVT family DNA-binding domain-containing protein [Gemmatimonadales bacterium]
MRVKETVIRPIGNSAGVTIPKAMLVDGDFAVGDSVYLRRTPDGILITAHDPAFEKTMEIAARISKRYRNALRELSKR